MLETIAAINARLNDIVWGPYMLALLVGTGVFLTFRVKFLQVRKFGFTMKHTLGTLTDKNIQDKSVGGVTPFQAVSTALASTVGTGNITGVATAIATGGPGAVFWMWLSAFFGMITKYSEIVLSIHFREKNDKGEWAGGPMYYLEKGLHQKWLAVLFAVFALVASFGIGNMTQANSIAVALNTSFHLNKLAIGIVLAILVALVIIGGIKRISTITSYIVPFMAIFYVVLGAILLIMNASYIPGAFKYIFQCAFNPQALFGGGLGYTMMMAMRYGALPLVRETGGLEDTVEPYNQFTQEGDGFTFDHYNAHDMLHVIEWAYDIYHHDRPSWEAMARRAMAKDFGWHQPAQAYIEVYEGLNTL